MMRKLLRVLLVTLMSWVWVMADAAPVAAADVVNLSVPYIHQENDPPDDPLDDGSWDGGGACGAATVVMLVAYWGKLPPNVCGDCNSNPYSWYVNQKYTNSYGTYYDTGHNEPGGEQNEYWGAYGYIYSGTVLTRAKSFLEAHGFVCATETNPTEQDIKDELDAGYPVYKHTTIGGGSGHEIVIRGYTDDGKYIVNDPLWGENIQYLWASIETGSMITVRPDTDQTWYLSNTAASPDYRMYREDTGKTDTTVSVAESATEYWQADEAAQGAVTFPAGSWNVAVYMNAAPSTGNDFTGHLGTYDPGGPTYTEEHWWNFTGANGSRDYWSVSFNPGSITVPDGDYLAFWIVNTNDASDEAVAPKVGSSNSVVISPTSDPGYPIPELTTVVLVAVGLAALGGYYMFARRRRHSATKS